MFAPSEWAWGSAARDVRVRAGIALGVATAHIVLFIVMGRGAQRLAEVVQITLVPLPISFEERKREVRPAVKSIVMRKVQVRPAAPAPQPQTSTELQQDAPRLPEPTPSIDWYAEASEAANEQQQRARAEAQRRSFARPDGTPMRPAREKPCPFEQCEPGWGRGFSIFEQDHTKAGRIEKTADGEVIRWKSNNCYQILISADPRHRGATKCFVYLQKRQARGDLFEHMREVPPPAERATDVP